jgi:hypothetical protein
MMIIQKLIKLNHMKIKIAAASAILMFTILSVGCGSLNKNAKGLNISQTIPAQSRMLIQVEDKSGFNLDIENMSEDTLVLERKGLDNLMITKASVKAIIEPEAAVSLVNPSSRGAEVRVKVTNHKGKVLHSIQRVDTASKATP